MSESDPLEPATLDRGAVLAGRYVIDDALARGGSSVVYRGRDRLIGRAVAVKTVSPDLVSPDAERLAREALILASVAHPNLPVVYDAGEQDGLAYVVMELIDGRSLASLVHAGGIERIEDGVRWAIQVCGALAHLHRNGVVHRDVKPQNILVTDEGLVKLVDLGVARAPRAGDAGAQGPLAGTAQYLAPEVAAGGDATARSDLYSLGVVLYRLFTGRLPFEGRGLPELAMRHHSELPPAPASLRPDMPPPLAAILLRLLEKSPGRRYASADALAADLVALLESREGRPGATAP